MQINRYINGEKTKRLTGLRIGNQEVMEAVAEAARRAKEDEEKA